MALEQKLTLSEISDDQLTLIDETTYGGANPLRSQYGIHLIGYKKGLPNEVDVALTIQSNNNNPVTDDIWYADTEEDGYHSFHMYNVPVYSGAANYTINQCVFYPTGNAYYKCLSAISGVTPGTNPTYWELLPVDEANIDATTDAFEAADNVVFNYFNFLPTLRGDNCFSDLAANAATKGCCDGCSDSELKQTYERLEVLLTGVEVFCTRQMYVEAEQVVRNITYIREKSKCACS